MIEGNEIFEKIKKDSQTTRQVITETNYIIDELKDCRNSFAETNEKCPLCGDNIVQIDLTEEDREMLGQPCKEKFTKYGCDSCNYVIN